MPLSTFECPKALAIKRLVAPTPIKPPPLSFSSLPSILPTHQQNNPSAYSSAANLSMSVHTGNKSTHSPTYWQQITFSSTHSIPLQSKVQSQPDHGPSGLSSSTIQLQLYNRVGVRSSQELPPSDRQLQLQSRVSNTSEFNTQVHVG